MTGLSRTDWRTIVRRIHEGKLTPFISERVGRPAAVEQSLIQAWAADIGYPFGTSFSITRLAQYLRVTLGEDLAAKEEFLSFTRRHLSTTTGEPDRPPEVAATEVSETSFAELAASMQAARENDPIVMLARLPLPVYITTSYHDRIEQTLSQVGKRPRAEICYWRDDLKQSANAVEPLAELRQALVDRFDEEELRTLCFDLGIEFDELPGLGSAAKTRELIAFLERHQRLDELRRSGPQLRPDIPWSNLLGAKATPVPGPSRPRDRLPSVFDEEPSYVPSIDEPLVYHLHGLESCPGSLVLTEDDYLDFLLRVAWDHSVIPPRVAQALADSSLLLLGYRLQDWDFRVLFRGLINRKSAARRRLSIAIQLTPEQEMAEQIESADEAQDYLEKYFDLANFKIYWGDSASFMQELAEQWEA